MNMDTYGPHSVGHFIHPRGRVMKRMLSIVLAEIAILTFTPKLCLAADGEGGVYLEKCKAAVSFAGPGEPTPIEAMNMGFCMGLMDGLRGANYFLRRSDPASAFCEPADFDNSDLAKTFVAGASANPELRSLRGALAAQAALAAAYPCK